MTDMYDLLSRAYDRFNGHVDYEAWADYYKKEIDAHGIAGGELVLDLGCGTGGLTFPLLRRGYDMTALDGSPEMLAEARRRAEKEDPAGRILWLCADMTDFELYGTVDAAVSSLDCLNHLESDEEIRACLALVHNYLAPNGLFLFDLNSPRRFREVYGDRAYLFEDKNGFLAWQNSYRERSGICDFTLTYFEKERGQSYRRSEAFMRERMITPKKMKRLLAEAGFSVVTVAGDLDGRPYTENDMRVYFTARALKEERKEEKI